MAALPPPGRVLQTPRLGWLTAPLVAAGALGVVFPFFWMAVTSLKTVPEIQRLPVSIFPGRWSNLDNYREVFQRQPFGRFLLNSALVASIAALSSAVVSSLAGYGFAKFRFPGHGVLFFAIVGILMVPFQSVVVPLYLWVNRLGLLDTYAGIVAPDLVSVFGVFLMRQSIEVVPSDYVDAARIAGEGELGVFWRVILLAVKPATATTYGSYIRRSSASLSSAPSPACRTTSTAARPVRRRASSDAGSRSGAEPTGGRPSTWARSTTAWRAIANVRPAWRAHAPSMPTITSALASSTVVSAASHDWLSCCER